MSTIELEHRGVGVRVGLLGRADGSCQWTQGGTSVIAAVYGPHAPKRREHNHPERAYVHVKVLSDHPQPLAPSHRPHTAPTALKHALRHAFQAGQLQILDTLYPRSQISIVVQIVRDEGSILASSLNAVGLALVDAGIALGATLTAASSVALRPSALASDSGLTPAAERGGYGVYLDVPSSAVGGSRVEGEGTFGWDGQGRLVLAHWAWAPSGPYATASARPVSQELFWTAKEVSREGAKRLAHFSRQVQQRKILYEANATARASQAQTPAAQPSRSKPV